MIYSRIMKQYKEEDIRSTTVFETAKRIATAARTAPKGKGVDNLAITVLDKEGILEVSNTIKRMSEEEGAPAFFLRDAENILQASAMLVLGTRIEPMGLSPCGLCGFGNCDGKREHPDAPCAFNTGDLGIAVGSAVSMAADNRLDNRVMYTVGMAALKMNLLGEKVKIAYGIPLSASGKNPFFDRKPG
jgi:uncharacterized ferredoxin-like protein